MREKVRVGRSPIAGKGLFAVKGFKRGQNVCEYTGKLVKRGYERLNRYLVEVNCAYTIDGSSMANKGRWANHCCKPNALMISKGYRVWIRAKKKIAPGEEIFVDYGTKYTKHYMKTCKCPSCRKDER